MKRIFQILFSAIVWTFAFAFMAVLSVITIVILPLVPYRKSHSWVAAPGFAVIARLATLGRFKMVFHPDFNPDRRSVFCMNHTNLLDAHVASATIPHAFCGLMDRWQFRIPFYGWLMALSKGIPVDRKRFRGRQLLDQIVVEAKKRKEWGFSILVFPEGHRTLDGKLRPFRKGVFTMAKEAGYPVVPLAARGMFNVNRKGSRLFSPAPVTVFVGPQFETKDLTESELDDLVSKVRGFIQEKVEEEGTADCVQDKESRQEVVAA